MNVIDWLGMWVMQQAYKGWSSDGNFKIISISNPGWMLVVNLKNSSLASVKNYQEGKVNHKNDWYFVSIKNNLLRASGDPSKLFLLLERFINLSNEAEGCNPISNGFLPNSVEQLAKWYETLCKNQWHLDHSIKIMSSELPGWQVDIDLKETELDEVEQKYKYTAPNNLSWYGWEVKQQQFIARSSPQNLSTLMDVFVGVVNEITEQPILENSTL